MAETNKNYQITMSQVLASKGIASLGDTLHLTEEQKAKAASAALQLSSSATLYKCDKYSLAKYCFETARYNFTRDDCVYPVPYGNYVQAQIGYKGFRELCMRSNLYREIDAVEVLSCDKIKRNRTTGKVEIEFEEDYTKTENATVIGYYAFATDKDGSVVSSLFWSVEKCKEHGTNYSKTFANGPWATSFDKMAKKTVIKQLCSTLRTTPELEIAIKQDQIVYGGENEDDTYKDNPSNELHEIVDEEEPIVSEEDRPF